MKKEKEKEPDKKKKKKMKESCLGRGIGKVLVLAGFSFSKSGKLYMEQPVLVVK